MKEALECGCGFFPPDTQPAKMLKPSDRAFHGPPFLISAKAASILGRGVGSAVATVRGDHLDALLGQGRIQRVAVISLVADQPLRVLGSNHEFEELLHQSALMRRGRSAAGRHGQSLGIDHNHDFDTFAGLGAANAVPTGLGLAE